jgi:hypothetical protein
MISLTPKAWRARLRQEPRLRGIVAVGAAKRFLDKTVIGWFTEMGSEEFAATVAIP